jgi:phytoene dehydrogenase-like protein
VITISEGKYFSEIWSTYRALTILMDTNFQSSFAERCFSLIDEYAPGFSSSVIGYDMLTPPDLEREFGLTGKSLSPYYVYTVFCKSRRPGTILYRFSLLPVENLAKQRLYSHFPGGNIFHGAMGLDSLFLMRPAKGWYVGVICILSCSLVPSSTWQSLIHQGPELMPLRSYLTYFRFAQHRSDYRTPVKGLYLCGSGAHPGGGVMGAPGRNAASVVLDDLKER